MNETNRPLDAATRPFAAAMLIADADDDGNLPALNAHLLESLGEVEVGDVHTAWVASCMAAVEGWQDLYEQNLSVVTKAGLIEAAKQATAWLSAAVTADHWVGKVRRGSSLH